MPRITFEQPDGSSRSIEARVGYSVMEVAVDHGIPGVEAECGGSLTCSTCHCHVDEAWMARVGPPSAPEAALLQFAFEPGHDSRLTCQIDVTDDLDGLRLRVPARQN